MPTYFDAWTEAEVRARIARLTPETARLWGTMNAHQMVCHLIDGFRVPLAELAVAPRSNFLRFKPLRWLFVYLLPWPKGKIPTTREFKDTQPGDFAADVATWNAACDRFVARGRDPEGSFGPHPTFGQLSREEWGRLAYEHTCHHLRQFGV